MFQPSAQCTIDLRAGAASFHVDWRGRRPRLLVLDGGPRFGGPVGVTLPVDPYAESGRGLAIVRAPAIETEFGNRAEGGGFASITLHSTVV